MKVLVFNCGSSSVKYKMFQMPEETLLADGLVQRVGNDDTMASQKTARGKIEKNQAIPDYPAAFALIRDMLIDEEKGVISDLCEINVCGHRVVHGGEAFTGSMDVDDELERAIEAVFDLAPLHNPPNLTGIREASKMFCDIPQVACFDTAFHQTLPEIAYRYALPETFYKKYQIRRYGFHGISHRYVARRAAELMNKHKYDVNLITCHLGNGSSLAAIRDGHSVDTSMGVTPLEGLVMGSRSGDLDPAIVFHLMRKGYTSADLDKLLNKQSGLLGVSEQSNDVRDLELLSEKGDRKSTLALDLFAYRVKKYIGAYMAVLNRVDAIVFTGGIGERGSQMRKRILSEMDYLGIILDNRKNNDANGNEAEIQAENSRVRIFVIPTNEELSIARDAYLSAQKKQTN